MFIKNIEKKKKTFLQMPTWLMEAKIAIPVLDFKNYGFH
jgi:hypothetical protein